MPPLDLDVYHEQRRSTDVGATVQYREQSQRNKKRDGNEVHTQPELGANRASPQKNGAGMISGASEKVEDQRDQQHRVGHREYDHPDQG